MSEENNKKVEASKPVKEGSTKSTPHLEKQFPSKNSSLDSNKCVAEDCKKSPTRAGFCDEHYEWFKSGLLTIDGYKAKDFEKKYGHFLRKKSKAA